MALTKYRLVHVEGLSLLDTPAGRFRLEQIDDAVAAQLHAAGSRYVEPAAAASPVTVDEVALPAAAKGRKPAK